MYHVFIVQLLYRQYGRMEERMVRRQVRTAPSFNAYILAMGDPVYRLPCHRLGPSTHSSPYRVGRSPPRLQRS